MRVGSHAAAELAKLLENTFRHVNIALVNELAMVAADLDVDVWEVIDAAATKPFGFMKFSPGPGVGGHCLPIDPSYLSWTVRRRLGRAFRFVELANDINDHMPDYVHTRLVQALNRRGLAMSGARVLLLGLAYKRNSSRRARVPGGPARRPPRRGAAPPSPWSTRTSVEDVLPDVDVRRAELSPAELAGQDAVVLVTDHDAFDYEAVVDARAPTCWTPDTGWRVLVSSTCDAPTRRDGGRPRARVAVVVSGWPRLSETFALNELLALHRAGMLAGIFATKPGESGIRHPAVAELEPAVTMLGCRHRREPGSRGRRPRLAEAGVSAVHGYFAHRPAEVAAVAARLLGVPYGFSVHALDARKVTAEELRARAAGASVVLACNADVAATVSAAGARPRLRPPRRGPRGVPCHPASVVRSRGGAGRGPVRGEEGLRHPARGRREGRAQPPAAPGRRGSAARAISSRRRAGSGSTTG